MKSTVPYFLLALFFVLSCSKSDSNETEKLPPLSLPVLTTASVSEITEISALSGGNISEDGGASISTRGICWSTSTEPTLSDNKTTNDTGIGEFSSSLDDLDPNTTYYIRSYATNSEGTAYGNEVSFTTLEPQVEAKVFEGEVRLATQKEVNDFGVENYTKIIGDVYIQGATQDVIVDLGPLKDIERIEGALRITGQTDLNNIDGLINLSFVTERILIISNDVLENLDGFLGLTNALEIQLGNNDALLNINGLQNLTSLGSFVLTGNEKIENVDSLEGITGLAGGLIIDSNGSLLNLNGLNSLTEVNGGGFEISRNGKLQNINGFNNLISLPGNIWIINNSSLKSVIGFSQLKTINSAILIQENEDLTDISAFDNLEYARTLNIERNPSLKSIKLLRDSEKYMGKITIENNPSLIEVSGFDNLILMEKLNDAIFDTAVLRISNNLLLASIPSFSSLINVEGSLEIDAHDVNDEITVFERLETINGDLFFGGDIFMIKGFENLTTVDFLSITGIRELEDLNNFSKLENVNRLNIGGLPKLIDTKGLLNINELSTLSILNCESLVNLEGFENLLWSRNGLKIQGNSALIDFCSLNKLAQNNGVDGGYFVDTNGYNPTWEDLKSGNCSQ